MMISVLITGGAGYVGSVLTRELLERGFAVTVLDNFRFRQTSLLECCHHESLRIVRGDCRDERTVAEALRDADIVIPLAAVVGAPLCDRDRVGAETINLGAVRMLLTKLSRDQRLLFPATNSGYGIGEKDTVSTEDSPLRPISLYGVTKAEAERAVLDRGDAITFRLATAFGISPRMRLDLLVNDFVWRAVTDRAVVVFEGRFRRNFIHVRDIVKAFLHGIEHYDAMKGRPYNVGLEDANLTKLELCAEIGKVVPGFTVLEAPIGEDPDKRDYLVSNARILSTGFRPEWTLERGIRELVRGYTVLGPGTHSNAG